jgi:dTDP-4-dehydrorhamnose 3,5-epimerase-like enzyme
MIKFIDRYFITKDSRGALEGLIDFGTWEEINYIYSESGVTRGHHYHKYTSEAFFIISGKIKITTQKVDQEKLIGLIEFHTVNKGQVFIINPKTFHIFEILEDSEWINILSDKMDSVEPDIFRIK